MTGIAGPEHRLTPRSTVTAHLVALAVILMALVMAASAEALPWATMKASSAPTRTLRGGPLAIAVVILALCIAVGAAVLWRKPAERLYSWLVLLSGGSVGTCIALALDKISEANQTSFGHIGPTQTSFASGAAVGLLAAVAILVVAMLTRPASQVTAAPWSGGRLGASATPGAGVVPTRTRAPQEGALEADQRSTGGASWSGSGPLKGDQQP